MEKAKERTMDRMKIASELVKLAKELQAKGQMAASPIAPDDLPSDRLALIKRVFGSAKIVGAWDGIHGLVALVDAGMSATLDASDLKRLASDRNFRWIEPSGDGKYSIGF